MSIRQTFRVSTATLVAALLVSCGSVPNPPASPSGDAPTVSMVVPQSNGVATNRDIAVVFSDAMDPASINSSTFRSRG